jgi:FlaA1/EpsC-like NDP-sugar epimerase
MWGGEIFVPKIPSFKITDLAAAVAPACRRNIVGIRPGEKLHEEMITSTDALSTVELQKYFVILPSIKLWDVDSYIAAFDGKFCVDGFCYNSGTNSEWLSVRQIRELIKAHVDPAFTV